MRSNPSGVRPATSRNDAGSSAPGGSEVLLLKPVQAAKSLAISPRKLWGMTTSGEIWDQDA